MTPAEQIRHARVSRGITPAFAAAFVNLSSVEAYMDLEFYDDEYDTLTVIEFLRLCVMLDLEPSQILPPETAKAGETQLQFATDEEALASLRSALLAACPDINVVADTLGWEAEALDRWLTTMDAFGEMPMPALEYICDYLQVSLADFLGFFFRLLRHSVTTEDESTKTV